MKRRYILILAAIVLAIMGYLGYDYFTWNKYLDPDPSISLYSWTDAQGVRHYTDNPPPAGARDIKVTQGFKHRKLPLVMRLKEKIVSLSRRDSVKTPKKPSKK